MSNLRGRSLIALSIATQSGSPWLTKEVSGKLQLFLPAVNMHIYIFFFFLHCRHKSGRCVIFQKCGTFPEKLARFVQILTWWQNRGSRSPSHSCCSAESPSSPLWHSAGSVGSSRVTSWAAARANSPRRWWCSGDRRRSGWRLLAPGSP